MLDDIGYNLLLELFLFRKNAKFFDWTQEPRFKIL